MQKIDSIEMLETIYSAPVGERSIWKEIDGETYDQNYAEHMRKTIY